MFQSRRRDVEASLHAGEAACLERGRKIYDVLHSDELDIDQYLTLNGAEWQCLRMYAKREHPGMRLDMVWHMHGDDEVYRVRLDWDIESIEEVLPES